MTCIVGLVDSSGKVWLGGDCRSTSGTVIHDGENGKIWERELNGKKFLFGASGMSSTCQFLQHCVTFPDKEFHENKETLIEFMVREWVLPMRQELMKYNAVKLKDSVAYTDCTLVMGYNGKLYTMDSALHFLELSMPIAGTGSGGAFAQGVLWTYQHLKSEVSPEDQLRTAIRASMEYCDGVGGRIDVLST